MLINITWKRSFVGFKHRG